ncbi:GNAT superfamily N-acetyltransferase [Mycobacterium sp. AZCC_0083]|nr:GNAT superfamily N-acetyltransferase [Mycobacterium sp. AZCC_0083]
MPEIGTRVSLRYRLPAGSVPPLTDVVGHLLEVGPALRVRTKRGDVVDVAAADVVAIKALSDAPVRTGDIRNVEYAAARAWPGVEQQWIDGWLLRYGHGSTRRANSAVPLEVRGDLSALPAIIDWYAARSATPLLVAPDRLFRVPPGVPVDGENVVMTRELTTVPASAASVTMAPRPDERWLQLYERGVPLDVLTAVVDGEVMFGSRGGAAVARVAVTSAPDGTRWAGLAAVHVSEAHRRKGHARALCEEMLGWAAGRGATRGYAQVLADNAPAIDMYESMGFTTQHRVRYVDARTL